MSTNNDEYARLATPPDKSSLSEVGILHRASANTNVLRLIFAPL
jgi:hypothetical protein